MNEKGNLNGGCHVIGVEIDQEERNRLARVADATAEQFQEAFQLGPENSAAIQVYLCRGFWQLKEQVSRHGATLPSLDQVTGITWIESGVHAAGLWIEGHPIRTSESILQQQVYRAMQAASFNAPLPTWLSEGMAASFGDSPFIGEKLMSGLHTSARVERLRLAQADHRLIPLPIILGINSKHLSGWADLDTMQHTLFVDSAWAIVQFLWHAFPRSLDVKTLIEAERAGKAPADALSAALEGTPIETITQGLELWLAALKPSPMSIILERLDIIADWMATLSANNMLFAMNSIEKLRVLATEHQMNLYRPGQQRLALSSQQLYTYPDGHDTPTPDLPFQLCEPNGPGLPNCVRASGISELEGGSIRLIWYRNRRKDLLWDYEYTIGPAPTA